MKLVGMARIRTYPPLLVPRLSSPLLLRTRPIQLCFKTRYFKSIDGIPLRRHRCWNVGLLVDYASGKEMEDYHEVPRSSWYAFFCLPSACFP